MQPWGKRKGAVEGIRERYFLPLREALKRSRNHFTTREGRSTDKTSWQESRARRGAGEPEEGKTSRKRASKKFSEKNRYMTGKARKNLWWGDCFPQNASVRANTEERQGRTRG